MKHTHTQTAIYLNMLMLDNSNFDSQRCVEEIVYENQDCNLWATHTHTLMHTLIHSSVQIQTYAIPNYINIFSIPLTYFNIWNMSTKLIPLKFGFQINKKENWVWVR